MFFFENQEGVSLSQAAVRISSIHFFGGNKGVNYYLFINSSTPVNSPVKYSALVMDSENYESTVTFADNVGLVVNEVGSSGTTNIQIGETYTIRTQIGFNTWDNSTTQTHTLLTGNNDVGLPD